VVEYGGEFGRRIKDGCYFSGEIFFGG